MRALTAAQMHAADTSGMAERGETALMAQAGAQAGQRIGGGDEVGGWELGA